MANLDFGFIMTVFGMGGTLIILFLLSLMIDLLNKLFPYRDKE